MNEINKKIKDNTFKKQSELQHHRVINNQRMHSERANTISFSIAVLFTRRVAKSQMLCGGIAQGRSKGRGRENGHKEMINSVFYFIQ